MEFIISSKSYFTAIYSLIYQCTILVLCVLAVSLSSTNCTKKAETGKNLLNLRGKQAKTSSRTRRRLAAQNAAAQQQQNRPNLEPTIRVQLKDDEEAVTENITQMIAARGPKNPPKKPDGPVPSPSPKPAAQPKKKSGESMQENTGLWPSIMTNKTLDSKSESTLKVQPTKASRSPEEKEKTKAPATVAVTVVNISKEGAKTKIPVEEPKESEKESSSRDKNDEYQKTEFLPVLPEAGGADEPVPKTAPSTNSLPPPPSALQTKKGSNNMPPQTRKIGALSTTVMPRDQVV